MSDREILERINQQSAHLKRRRLDSTVKRREPGTVVTGRARAHRGQVPMGVRSDGRGGRELRLPLGS